MGPMGGSCCLLSLVACVPWDLREALAQAGPQTQSKWDHVGRTARTREGKCWGILVQVGGVAALLVWPFSVPENPGNIHRAPPLQPPPPRACGFRCAVALLGSQWLFPDPGPLSLWVETARAPIDSQGLVLHCPLCAVCSAGPCLGLWGGHLGTRPLLSPP